METDNQKTILLILVALVAPFVLVGEAQANDANNWGVLQVDIKLEGKQLNRSMGIVKWDFYYPGNTDGFGGNDIEEAIFLPDMSGGFADIEGHKVTSEYSANSSRTAKHVKGYFKGTIAPGSEPNIVAELTWLFAESTVGRF